MRFELWRCVLIAAVCSVPIVGIAAPLGEPTIVIPQVEETEKRLITIDDISRVRNIDTLSVSPDGTKYAIFVRQGDPIANKYHTAWFVGSTDGGPLVYVGDGGEITGQDQDQLETGSESRWSLDSEWIAYKLKSSGEVQLWRSKADGSIQEQVTHNAADVKDFVWSDDGKAIYFTVGIPRTELQARTETKMRKGYRYDQDLKYFTELMNSVIPILTDAESETWSVLLNGFQERKATEEEVATFKKLSRAIETNRASHDTSISQVENTDGAVAWLEPIAAKSRNVQLFAQLPGLNNQPIRCEHEQGMGSIDKVWWGKDGERVFFARTEGLNGCARSFYSWSPSNGHVRKAFGVQDEFMYTLEPGAHDNVVCVRETPSRPDHIVAIDLLSGTLHELADINPELQNIRVGRIERFEWDTPKFPWDASGKLAGLYEKRAYGYILYPPDFDPSKKYPVYVQPYVAAGFSHPEHDEYPLHVFAANGFVVLNMWFPDKDPDVDSRLANKVMEELYSNELGFPHLSMYAASTFRGIDTTGSHGFIDMKRLGIGGVSHGTFVPLYMLQIKDRITAISISSPNWGQFQYYWQTRKARDANENNFLPKPEGEGLEYYAQLDIAENIDEVEAPILMNLADREMFAMIRFIRHLADAGRPYDAYVFRDEGHLKWQPAHLHAIMNRNLDWFRFWLQDYEDPNPEKKAQYEYWRELRKLQDKNPRSLLIPKKELGD